MADSVDDLYALPLAEFTAARNALAKSSGDKSIAKLRKPSAPAWALNQAARSNKGDVARFLHAAARVRSAADRAALDDLRAAEADVRRAALAALGGKGNYIADVNALLAAAAADEDVAEVLKAGRLVGDEEAGAAMFAMAPVKGGKAKRPTSEAPKDEVRDARERKAREQARQKAEEAAAKAKEADEEADRLEREADEAEHQAARLRSRATTAREKADKAKAKAEELAAEANARRT